MAEESSKGMSPQLKVGAAVVGGYLLGRTKKAKLAITVGTALAGKKLNLDPKKLATNLVGELASSPELRDLRDQLSSQVFGAGKQMASSLVTAQAERLTSSLQERTENLRQGAEEGLRGTTEAAGDAASETGATVTKPRRGRESAADASANTEGTESDEEHSARRPASRKRAASTRRTTTSTARTSAGDATRQRSDASSGRDSATSTRKSAATAKSRGSSSGGGKSTGAERRNSSGGQSSSRRAASSSSQRAEGKTPARAARTRGTGGRRSQRG